MMINLKLAVRWFFTLSIPLLLVAASVRLLLSHEFLRIEYQRPGFPADPYGFTAADRLQYGMYAVDYLFQSGNNSALTALQLPRQKCWQPTGDAAHCALFNAKELRHLEDVRQVVATLFAVAASCALTATGLAIAAWYRPHLRRQVEVGLRRGAFFTLAAIFALAVAAAAAWDSAFDRFHEVFFAAGTWRFPYSDSLIRLYPEQLFADASLVIGGLCAAGAAITLLLLSIWDRRHTR